MEPVAVAAGPGGPGQPLDDDNNPMTTLRVPLTSIPYAMGVRPAPFLQNGRTGRGSHANSPTIRGGSDANPFMSLEAPKASVCLAALRESLELSGRSSKCAKYRTECQRVLGWYGKLAAMPHSDARMAL